MKKMIGFMADGGGTAERSSAPIKSLVKIRFESRHAPLAYYNDRFDLHTGDVVYVSGSMAGEPGVIVSVTTKFRIHTSDYERVLALLDLTLHGSFTRICDKMVSLGEIALSPEQFGSWVTPPKEPGTGQEEDEVISGEGYTIDINDPEACEDLSPKIAERAVNYCKEGRVRYLCIRGGVGRAYVEGSKWYRVDFRFCDGVMTDLYCDCPYPELCKHEAAVALTLRVLLHAPQLRDAGDFVALDHRLFWQLASRAETIVI